MDHGDVDEAPQYVITPEASQPLAGKVKDLALASPFRTYAVSPLDSNDHQQQQQQPPPPPPPPPQQQQSPPFDDPEHGVSTHGVKQGSDGAGSIDSHLHYTSLEDSRPRPAVTHHVANTRQKRTNDLSEMEDTASERPSKQANVGHSRPSRQNSHTDRAKTRSSDPRPGVIGTPTHGLTHSHGPTSISSATKSYRPLSASASPSSDCAGPPDTPPLYKQPLTRPISEPQLINEVKGIYAGLVMVEKKCVEIVAQQSQSHKRLEHPQWKALVALHRTLLQEHHDFFSASQHPTASEALKRLAIKYAMPARMWRHGIHAFLELLRHRLPESMEHMLSFIYLAYSMMALLKESVPSFIETWIECLGDLARYRMAVEDSDPHDRETWSNVARMWYNEAADKSPNVGRIQHHLAVLARPNIVEQLFYYTKALVSVVAFVNARESIMLLFDMFIKRNEVLQARYAPLELAFVHAFAVLFVRGRLQEFQATRTRFGQLFGTHIDRYGLNLKVQGPQMAMALFAGLLDFGRDDSPVWRMCRAHADTIAAAKQKWPEHGSQLAVLEEQTRTAHQREVFQQLAPDSAVDRVPTSVPTEEDVNIRSSEDVVALVGSMFSDATAVIAARVGDKNIVPFMHAVLANLWGLSFVPGALVYLEHLVPWSKLVVFLNTVGRSGVSYTNVEAESFPPSFGGFGKQLPEDFLLRGFVTSQYYYPVTFFTEQLVDEDERLIERSSHQAPRAERCLWLGVRLSTLNRYLTYDYDTKEFGTTECAAAW